MRKKITFHLFIAFCFAATCTCVQAQKIYKAKQNISEYAARLNSNESQLKRMVHAEFKNHNEVTVIDFTNTVTKESSTYRSSLQKFLKSENIFSITNTKTFVNTIKGNHEALTVIFPYKNKSIVIDLIPSDIFASDFKVYTDKTPGGSLRETSAYYKGVVRGTNASATISFFEDQVEGYIMLNDKTSVEITKLRGNNPTRQHAVYDDADMLVKGTNHYCTELKPPASELKNPKLSPVGSTGSGELTCITNFWETSYSVYQEFGSKKAVSAFLTSLFNVYATLYANEKIGMKLNATYIWTSADPYGNSLSTFSGTRTGFGANTAVLFSNDPYGGVAWLNTICFAGDYYRHAYCGSIARYETIMPITSYTWPVMVASHEVGHNLGSPHTHACIWNGDSTAIDGCGPTAGYSEGCTGPLPSNGGTVMSYCHLVSGVGINLTLGFGKQPGNLIRSNIATCITEKCKRINKTCNPPTILSVDNITTTTASVKWKAVEGAAYYYIYLSKDNGATYSLAADNLYATNYTLTGLKKSHGYICEVWAVCGSGSTSSDTVNFTTPNALLSGYDKIAALSFSVLPNPVRGSTFTVMLKKGYESALVEIVSGTNQVLYQSRGSNGVRNFVAPQTKGLYYVRVSYKGEIFSEKILVE